MSHYEIENIAERAEEKRMERQADKIHKSLEGQLSYTTEEWLKSKKNLS